ncbi:MAG: tyrosine--tRNA ligase [Treponema sp.]|nr:tyrosine--tRNA ligase [Treponema sp.]
MTLFEDLKWRGLIKDVAGEESDLQKVLDGKPFSFYWGTDPTADSLHLGHYSSLCMAKRLANAGHKPVLLCGGATGRIGDPRPTAEREIISEEKVNANINGIRAQIQRLVPTAELVDNYDWMKDYTFLNFLRDIGKYININYMLDKDIIRRRLETGITFAEFSYMLLQGYDFLHLFQEKNCIMQVAGSDQWGNITTGVDLIRKILNQAAYAFTMPLILDASGKKFGKSEGNALWLDKTKTSAYQIYQHLYNTDDSKVLEYLKVFTFLPREQIEEIYKQQEAAPETRIAQKTLAYEVVKDLHGAEEADKAVSGAKAAFSGEGNKDDMPTVQMEKSLIQNGIGAIDLFFAAKIGGATKSDVRRLIQQGGAAVNAATFNDVKRVLNEADLDKDGELVLRAGKKKFVRVVFK